MHGNSRLAVALAAALLALASGCQQPTVSATLQQPFAPTSQQTLRLASRWGFWDQREGRQRWLLAFPLPGAEDGPRDFLIYLILDEPLGEQAVAPGGVRGFLVQTVGALRGRTDFSGGTVRARKAALRPARRVVSLNLTCADGTHVVADATLEPAPHELYAFESEYAADVESLAEAAASQPATGTAPAERPAAAP